MRKLYLLLFIVSCLWAQDSASTFEEELLLFGEDDLLLKEDPIPIPTQTADSIASGDSLLPTDSTAEASDTSLVASDTAKSSPTTPEIPSQPLAEVIAPTLVLDNATMDKEYAVDIDKNAELYRSPQKALFLSLAVPGLGQAYAKRYWKTGLFATIEVGAIVGAIVMSKKSDRLSIEAHQYLDENFDIENLRNFYQKLYAWGSNHELYSDPVDTTYLVDKELFFGSYRDTTIDGKFVHGYELYVDTVKADIYKEAQDTLNAVQGWSDMTESYNTDTSSYAGLIDDNPRTWGAFYKESAFSSDPEYVNRTHDSLSYKLDNYDTTLAYDFPTFMRLINPEGSNPVRTTGYSSQQRTYIDMMQEVDRADDGRRAFLIGLVINHIASAADAMLTARKYNRELLQGQESAEEPEEPSKAQAILSNISIDNDLYYSAGAGVSTKVGLTWHF